MGTLSEVQGRTGNLPGAWRQEVSRAGPQGHAGPLPLRPWRKPSAWPWCFCAQPSLEEPEFPGLNLHGNHAQRQQQCRCVGASTERLCALLTPSCITFMAPPLRSRYLLSPCFAREATENRRGEVTFHGTRPPSGRARNRAQASRPPQLPFTPASLSSLPRHTGDSLAAGSKSVLSPYRAAHQDARDVFMLPLFLAAVLGRCGTPRSLAPVAQPVTGKVQEHDCMQITSMFPTSHPASTGLVHFSLAWNSPNVLKRVKTLIPRGPPFLFWSITAPPSGLAPQLSSWVSRGQAQVPPISKHPNASC